MDLKQAVFTVRFNTGEPALGWYGIVFRKANGLIGFSRWHIDSMGELIQRVAEWDNNPPLKDWTIKSIEKIGEPGQ